VISTLLLAATAAFAAPTEFDAFFDEFTRKRQNIQSLQAEYTEKSITPDETFISEGGLLFTQPRRIVRRTFYPYSATVVIDGTEAVEYEPEVKQAVLSDLSQVREADILFFGFESDTKKLRENYDVKLFEIKDNPLGKNGLEIRPKESDKEPPFQSVTLYLADDTLLPYRIHVIFDGESELQVDMGDYTINATLSAEQTQVQLAEGTKLIRDDKVLETVGPQGKWMPEKPAQGVTPLPAEDAQPGSKATEEPGLVEVKSLDDAPSPAPAP